MPMFICGKLDLKALAEPMQTYSVAWRDSPT